MKIQTLLFAVVLICLVSPSISATLCQSINPITNIPCDVVTPVLYCSDNAIVTDLNTTANYSIPMTARGDGTYQFSFNYGVDEYLILLCDNTTTTLSVTRVSTTPVYYPIPQTFGTQRINIPNSNLSIAVQVTQYPYIDFNSTVSLYVDISYNGTPLSTLATSLFVTELNGSLTDITIPFDNVTGVYTVGLLFDQIGNFPFYIYVNGTGINENLTAGTFMVRQPFYVYARIYKQKDLSNYQNNYGYVTAEFANGRKINSFIEPFAHSLTDISLQEPVFHAEYIDGTARLKLYENATYFYRFTDSVTYNSTYGKAQKQKLFPTEMYLGEQYSNQSTMYQFVLNDRESDQWNWVLNWGTIIGLILVVFGAVVLFFIFPRHAWISLIFAILFGGIIILLRVIIFIWGLFS